jgi:hypothetical protein
MSFDSRIQLVYVSRQRIRALFNEGKYWTRARNGEFTLEYIYNKLAPARAGKPRGTKSQIVAYINSNGDQIALVHQYLKSDGTLGGGGQPDPKELLEGEVLYKIDYGDID